LQKAVAFTWGKSIHVFSTRGAAATGLTVYRPMPEDDCGAVQREDDRLRLHLGGRNRACGPERRKADARHRGTQPLMSISRSAFELPKCRWMNDDFNRIAM